MARTPDGAVAREISVTARMTTQGVEKLDTQRRARGGMTRSAYIRWLVNEDEKRLRRERLTNTTTSTTYPER